jgi:hypothetical protein
MSISFTCPLPPLSKGPAKAKKELTTPDSATGMKLASKQP